MDEDQYQKAVTMIKDANKVSTAYVQRELGIGYNEAERLLERMEKEGIIYETGKYYPRRVLQST